MPAGDRAISRGNSNLQPVPSPENPYPMKPASHSGLTALLSAAVLTSSATVHAQTPYDFGNPTSEEQLYIEYINRARANPPAEGTRLATTTDPEVVASLNYFHVDLAKLQTEFNALTAVQPLAPNKALTIAARGHNAWMLETAIQSHDQTDPDNDPGDRITAAGYDWQTYGENIYAYAKNVFYGHAGFQVDWGGSDPDGMQPGRGHRTSIHNGNFKEIGAGVLNGTSTVTGPSGKVGPQLITQDFGKQLGATNFGTGVVYYDLNANNFYDLGEAIPGVTVNVSGTTAYCLTASGGGWVVPIPSTAATRTVTFSGSGLNETRALTATANLNAKADLKLTYTPPAITSPATTGAGSPYNLTFTAIPGASTYRWDRWTKAAAPVETCDSLASVNVATSTPYNVLSTTVKSEGTASYHLVNGSTPGNQTVELKAAYHGGTSPSLTFKSLLKLSTTSEQYKMQVKAEGSTTWTDVYSQTGSTTAETAFSTKSVPLPAMAGKVFRIRFIQTFSGGSYYAGTGDNLGWFVDAITFTNTSVLTNNTSQVLTGTAGSFTPSLGSYLMGITPLIGGQEFPGASLNLTVTTPPAASYATWAAGIESANGLPAGTIANQPGADRDGDGHANLVEYAFGTSPVAANPSSTTRMPALQASTTHLVIRYVRDTSITDATLAPSVTSDLVNWKAPGESGAPSGFTDGIVSTTGNLQTREAKVPLTAGTRYFMRVKVSKP